MGNGAATIAQVVPEVREQLPQLPVTSSLEPEHIRFRFFDTLTNWFKRAAVRQPFLFILDDLHWADTSSLLLLQFLAREISDARLFVLGTYRDTEVNHGHPLSEALGALARSSRRLPLRGLAETAVAHLVAGTGLQPSAMLVSYPSQRDRRESFFSPRCSTFLLVTKTSRSLLFPFLMAYEKPFVAVWPVLSPACLQLLMRAAVIGREFTLDLLLRSNGVQTETDRLQTLTLVQEALTARLLVDASDKAYTYRFVHALIRETLYEDLALPERLCLHRHVGEAIENFYAGDLGPYLAELADHFFKAAASERSEKALQYALQAGERANGLLAHEEAAIYYERAFQLLPSQSVTNQRGEILLSMGHALARAGEPKRARATFSQAAAIARDLRTQGDSRSAALLLARAALGFSGHGDIATRFDQPMVNLLEEALAALPKEDSPLRVRVLGRWLWLFIFLRL